MQIRSLNKIVDSLLQSSISDHKLTPYQKLMVELMSEAPKLGSAKPKEPKKPTSSLRQSQLNVKANKSAADDAKAKNVIHLGGGYYGPKEDGPATYRHDAGSHKLTPLSNDERDSYIKNKETPPEQQKQKPVNPSANADPIKITRPALTQLIPSSFGHDDLLWKFIRNPTREVGEELQNKYNIRYIPSQKSVLYILTIGKYKLTGDDRRAFGLAKGSAISDSRREFAHQLVSKMRAVGVDVPGDSASGGASDIKKSVSEMMKPKNVLNDKPPIMMSSEPVDGGGVKMGSHTYHPIKNRSGFLKEVMMNINKNSPNADTDHLHDLEELAKASIDVYMSNIEKLKSLRDLSVHKLSGNDGIQRIVGRMIDTMEAISPGEDFSILEKSIQTALNSTQTVTELRYQLPEVVKHLSPSIRSGYPYIAELMSAIIQLRTNPSTEVLIPTNDAFELADMISLTSGKIDVNDPSKLAKHIQFIYVSTEKPAEHIDSGTSLVSTKFGEGAASGNKAKIAASSFFTEFGKESYPHVQSDLSTAAVLHNGLFSDNQSTKQSSIQFAHNLVRTYKKQIVDYYGFNKDIDDDSLIRALSTGKKPICASHGKFAIGSRTKASILVSNDPNKEAWAAWSVAGFASDAINNKMVSSQSWATHKWSLTGYSAIADGVGILTKSTFQFSRGQPRPTPNGGTKPNTQLSSKSVVATRSETRRDRPCDKN